MGRARGAAEGVHLAPSDQELSEREAEVGELVHTLSVTAAQEPSGASSEEVPQMCTARVVAFDSETGEIQLRVGRREVVASLDESVSPRVIATAQQRGERVVVERDADGWLVLGALRTSATPGVDAGEEFVIQAERVRIEAAHEFTVVSGMASLALRARGHVETLARDITTRAASVHKIVGRIVRLN
ncbi:MAG: hypothetical protein R3B72_50365 [Polyangiaceae bacterium]